MTRERAEILHVDMDAFFASCELVRHPELRGRPVIVGGSQRSVVLAATYEARAFGVHSAMPMAWALRMCPAAVVIPPDHHLYYDVSGQVMALFRSVTDLVEQISVDEAFLDVAGSRRRLGDPSEIARRIRAEVASRFQITCSVGIATTKSVAKIASGQAKPDGLVNVPAKTTIEFLHRLSVRELWGVGGKTAAALERWGVTTIAQLAHMSRANLVRAVGQAAAIHLHELAWGRDPRPVTPTHDEKSVGNEVTFETDLESREEMERVVLRLADQCGARLRRKGVLGKVVVIKVRDENFVTVTRSRTLATPTDVGHDIYVAARALFAALDLGGKKVRLLGVRAEGLIAADQAVVQPTFDDLGLERREVERVMDQARAKFGVDALAPAALVRTRSTSQPRGADLS